MIDEFKDDWAIDFGMDWAGNFGIDWAIDFGMDWAIDFGMDWAIDFGMDWAGNFGMDWAGKMPTPQEVLLDLNSAAKDELRKDEHPRYWQRAVKTAPTDTMSAYADSPSW